MSFAKYAESTMSLLEKTVPYLIIPAIFAVPIVADWNENKRNLTAELIRNGIPGQIVLSDFDKNGHADAANWVAIGMRPPGIARGSYTKNDIENMQMRYRKDFDLLKK